MFFIMTQDLPLPAIKILKPFLVISFTNQNLGQTVLDVNVVNLVPFQFSRERFGEMHARMWWEENRGRIQEQYL